MAGREDLSSSEVISFGPFRLFPAERLLEKAGTPVNLRGYALDILITLVSRPGKLVTKRELLDQVWNSTTVAEGTLRFHVSALRRALSDGEGGARYVTNIPGRGYCFVAPLSRATTSNGTPVRDGIAGLPHNLPTRTARIIGRDADIQTTTAHLLGQRLVTVVGPGGIGKTTVAIAVADMLLANFRNAVFFVDLAPLADPLLVPSALASVLGLIVQLENPLPTLVKFLRNKRALILLDNCDRVIEVAAELVDCIFKDAPGVHTLVTSREPLRVSGERVHRLAALESPPPKTEIKALEANSFPAVELFVERATASFDGFVFDDAAAPSVAEICRRLDGIPLAIELAVARVDFGVRGLAAGLNDMFALLTKGRRTAMPRHQTLRAMLDWGYQLLSPIEQTILRRVAAFRASFTLESAVTLASDNEIARQEVIDGVANLALKSFLTAETTYEIVQYRLLETTRAYAGEKLAGSGEGAALAQRHAKHYLALMQVVESDRETMQQGRWMGPYAGRIDDVRVRRYAGRIDDVRAALDWSFSQGGDLSIGLELIVESAPLWFQLSLNVEYRARVERALRRLLKEPERDTVMEMRLQTALGYVLWYTLSDPDDVERTFSRALELAEQVGEMSVQLQGLWGMWAARRARGQYREALALATRYEAIARIASDQASILLGDRILGLPHHYLGNQETARQLLERVQSDARGAKNARSPEFQLSHEVAAATLLIRILWLQGFPDQAAARLQVAIEAAQQSEHRFSMFYVLGVAGCPLSMWNGNFEETQKYLRIMTEYAPDNTNSDKLRQCWTLILRLRQGSERDSLIGSFYEPRVDISTFREIAELASEKHIPMPTSDDEVGDALWSLPEVLRVSAELLLWQYGRDTAPAAESKLRRSLDVARQQSSLSWELRSATSLARLWRGGGRVAEAYDLLVATCGRFTEGYDTADVIAARRLIAEWS
jgi:predicted ATPase/DNA-binding winged helix-turn-helix (wHTH) protein